MRTNGTQWGNDVLLSQYKIVRYEIKKNIK